jgi:hypothetical protein
LVSPAFSPFPYRHSPKRRPIPLPFTINYRCPLAESILKELKIPAEEIGHGVWRLKVDDITIVLYNQFERLQLFSGFAGFKAEPKFINEWNRTRRFSRAYLDDNNDPCLEADLNLQGGVTRENIKVFLQLYSLSVKNFAGQLAK